MSDQPRRCGICKCILSQRNKGLVCRALPCSEVFNMLSWMLRPRQIKAIDLTSCSGGPGCYTISGSIIFGRGNKRTFKAEQIQKWADGEVLSGKEKSTARHQPH